MGGNFSKKKSSGILGVLVVVGIAATSYGLYKIYKAKK